MSNGNGRVYQQRVWDEAMRKLASKFQHVYADRPINQSYYTKATVVADGRETSEDVKVTDKGDRMYEVSGPILVNMGEATMHLDNIKLMSHQTVALEHVLPDNEGPFNEHVALILQNTKKWMDENLKKFIGQSFTPVTKALMEQEVLDSLAPFKVLPPAPAVHVNLKPLAPKFLDLMDSMNGASEEIYQNTEITPGVTVKGKKTLDRYGVQLSGQ